MTITIFLKENYSKFSTRKAVLISCRRTVSQYITNEQLLFAPFIKYPQYNVKHHQRKVGKSDLACVKTPHIPEESFIT